MTWQASGRREGQGWFRFLRRSADLGISLELFMLVQIWAVLGLPVPHECWADGVRGLPQSGKKFLGNMSVWVRLGVSYTHSAIPPGILYYRNIAQKHKDWLPGFSPYVYLSLMCYDSGLRYKTWPYSSITQRNKTTVRPWNISLTLLNVPCAQAP